MLTGCDGYHGHADDALSDGNTPVTLAYCHSDDDVEDIGPSVLDLIEVREGNVGRCVTSCKKRLGRTSVFRRVTQRLGTEEVLEDVCIEEHEDSYWWR